MPTITFALKIGVVGIIFKPSGLNLQPTPHAILSELDTFILPISWGNMSDEQPSGVCESWVKGVLKRAESAAKTASQSAKEVH